MVVQFRATQCNLNHIRATRQSYPCD
eukprot:UN17204